MKERTPKLYNTLIIYTTEEDFTTRWQFFARTPLLVHRERYIWMDGRYMSIPTTDETRFFFDDQYVIIRQNDTITLGVLA